VVAIEEATLIKYAAEYGLFAILFVALFIWTLRENKRREEGYVSVINKLADEIIPELRGLTAKVDGILKKTD
jgi:hypothetical protein